MLSAWRYHNGVNLERHLYAGIAARRAAASGLGVTHGAGGGGGW